MPLMMIRVTFRAAELSLQSSSWLRLLMTVRRFELLSESQVMIIEKFPLKGNN
jgi:hypothetical protein